MKKITWKLIACFMAVLLLCMPVLTGCDKPEDPETTEEETTAKDSDGLEFTSNGDGTCSVSGIGECTDTDVVIPKKSPEGDRVTSIGERAFYDCTGLTSITIPDSVTSIEAYAFSKCSGLMSIVVEADNPAYHSDGNCLIETQSKTLIAGCQNSTIPSDGSVTSIDELAFYDCTGLTSITIPDSVTSIGRGAFQCCTGLTSITIPDSMTSIEDWVFNKCEGLTSITIPDSVTSIGRGAFQCCTSLTSITIPDSVTSIGGKAFSDCTGLTNITIPDSVTSIGDDAFSYCTGLTSITIPDSVTSIGEKAFHYCKDLTRIKVSEGNSTYRSQGDCLVETESKTLIIGCQSSIIPDDGSVTSIGSSAFQNCTGLTSITIPDSVTSIGAYAFYGCKGLTSITIPDRVTSIGEEAFRCCTGLTDVHFSGTKRQWKNIAIKNNDPLPTATIHCTDGDITPAQ